LLIYDIIAHHFLKHHYTKNKRMTPIEFQVYNSKYSNTISLSIVAL